MTASGIDVPRQFQLEDWNHVRAEFDWVYEGPVEPQYRESTLQHPGQSILLLRKGTVQIRTPKGTVRAGPGEWILPRQGNRHEKFSDDAYVLSIHVQLHWPGGQPLFEWDVAAHFDGARIPRLEAHSTRLRRLVEKRFPGAGNRLLGSPGSLSDSFLLRHYFAAWLHAFIDALLSLGFVPTRQGSIDPRLLGTVQRLDRLPLSAAFRERDFAELVNLSISQLDRLFVKQFGITPRRYFEKRKLSQAMAFVREAASIKEVAFELGFSSLPHFSGWFKQKTGLSPTQFQIQTRRRPSGVARK